MPGCRSKACKASRIWASASPKLAPKATQAPEATQAPKATATAKATTALRDRDAVYQVTGAGPVELRPSVGDIETSFGYWDNKGELVIRGRKASQRVAERQPVFLVGYSEGEATLVEVQAGLVHPEQGAERSEQLSCIGHHGQAPGLRAASARSGR